jgi:hypothetical protein
MHRHRVRHVPHEPGGALHPKKPDPDFSLFGNPFSSLRHIQPKELVRAAFDRSPPASEKQGLSGFLREAAKI